jgi:hypothetical protein
MTRTLSVRSLGDREGGWLRRCRNRLPIVGPLPHGRLPPLPPGRRTAGERSELTGRRLDTALAQVKLRAWKHCGWLLTRCWLLLIAGTVCPPNYSLLLRRLDWVCQSQPSAAAVNAVHASAAAAGEAFAVRTQLTALKTTAASLAYLSTEANSADILDAITQSL